MYKTLVVILLALAVQACNLGGGPCDGITYTFDGYTDKEENLSYEISVLDGQLRFKISTFAESLYDTTFQLGEAKYKEITDLCTEPIAGFEATDNYMNCESWDCGRKILLFQNPSRTSLEWTEGNTGKQVEVLIALLKGAIPDFEAHIADNALSPISEPIPSD